jgi:hypothetical protein
MDSKTKTITGIIGLAMGLSLQQVDAQQEEFNATKAVMEAITDAVDNATNTNANATEYNATESLLQAMNALNVTANARGTTTEGHAMKEANRLLAEAQQATSKEMNYRNCIQMIIKGSGDISEKDFKVKGSDPHRFDGDDDGRGCE